MKKTIIVVLLFIASAVSAHEFWIEPDKFIYKRGGTINLRFLVGENFTGANWSGDKDRVQSMRLYFSNVVDSNFKDNFRDKKGDSIQFAIYEEGTAMVTLNTKNTFIGLDAKEFNAYLHEEGLTEALEYRRQRGDSMKKGTEKYQRSVKTIFQVGSNKTHVFKKRTDLQLDIIPDDNPYSLAKDGGLKLKLLFQGNALKKTRVKVWHKANNKVNVEDYETDDEGEVKIFIALSGEWMVSCVKMLRTENDPDAEWQSYWGTLTWGYY
jgi:uncharacterized GH25 family protein